jgi:hypothetical protein
MMILGLRSGSADNFFQGSRLATIKVIALFWHSE